MKSITPQSMIEMAESLEATAKALRQSAETLKQFAAIWSPEPQSTPQSVLPNWAVTNPKRDLASVFDGKEGTVTPSRTPTVLEAVKQVLAENGQPMHVNDIFNHIIARGAQIKEIGNLSSMLSRDNGANVVIPPGMRGFWWLAGAKTPRALGVDDEDAPGVIHPAR